MRVHFETTGVLECVSLSLAKLPIIIALHLVNLMEKAIPFTFDTAFPSVVCLDPCRLRQASEH
jgi:hypothetical protein